MRQRPGRGNKSTAVLFHVTPVDTVVKWQSQRNYPVSSFYSVLTRLSLNNRLWINSADREDGLRRFVTSGITNWMTCRQSRIVSDKFICFWGYAMTAFRKIDRSQSISAPSQRQTSSKTRKVNPADPETFAHSSLPIPFTLADVWCTERRFVTTYHWLMQEMIGSPAECWWSRGARKA